jgi:hypothetical protein
MIIATASMLFLLICQCILSQKEKPGPSFSTAASLSLFAMASLPDQPHLAS